MVQAEKRKIEYERRNERLIQKEREAEGDKFKDKEAFVTSSYKEKLEELKKLDEEDLKFSMIEDINDVTKQRDMGSFYRHLYKAELCSNENNEETDEVKKSVKKSDTNRQYRKRASSNSSNSSNENTDEDKDTDVLDSDSSESSPKRSKIETPQKNDAEGEVEEKLKIKPEDKLPIKKPELKEISEAEAPKEKKTKKKEIEPKDVVPKKNIWEKRTIGDIYEAARQRYFERKMKQVNIHVQS